MTWWDLHRLLRNIEHAADRWQLVEATREPGEEPVAGDRRRRRHGRWHIPDAYTDLSAVLSIKGL